MAYEYVGAGPSVRPDWVPTRLVRGDMLSTLAPLYKHLIGDADAVKAIVAGNGVSFTPEAIEGDKGWVERSGSKTRLTIKSAKLGYRWVFDENSVILLPRGGPRQAVTPGTPAPGTPAPGTPGPLKPVLPEPKEAGMGGLAILFGAAAIALLVLVPKKKKGKTPRPVQYGPGR